MKQKEQETLAKGTETNKAVEEPTSESAPTTLAGSAIAAMTAAAAAARRKHQHYQTRDNIKNEEKYEKTATADAVAHRYESAEVLITDAEGESGPLPLSGMEHLVVAAKAVRKCIDNENNYSEKLDGVARMYRQHDEYNKSDSSTDIAPSARASNANLQKVLIFEDKPLNHEAMLFNSKVESATGTKTWSIHSLSMHGAPTIGNLMVDSNLAIALMAWINASATAANEYFSNDNETGLQVQLDFSPSYDTPAPTSGSPLMTMKESAQESERENDTMTQSFHRQSMFVIYQCQPGKHESISNPIVKENIGNSFTELAQHQNVVIRMMSCLCWNQTDSWLVGAERAAKEHRMATITTLESNRIRNRVAHCKNRSIGFLAVLSFLFLLDRDITIRRCLAKGPTSDSRHFGTSPYSASCNSSKSFGCYVPMTLQRRKTPLRRTPNTIYLYYSRFQHHSVLDNNRKKATHMLAKVAFYQRVCQKYLNTRLFFSSSSSTVDTNSDHANFTLVSHDTHMNPIMLSNPQEQETQDVVGKTTSESKGVSTVSTEWVVYVDQSKNSLDRGGSATLDAFLALAPKDLVTVHAAYFPAPTKSTKSTRGPCIRCIAMKLSNDKDRSIDSTTSNNDDKYKSSNIPSSFDVGNVDSVDKVHRILTKYMQLPGINLKACECLKWKYKGNGFLEAGKIDLAIDCYDKALATSVKEQEGIILLMRATAYLQRAAVHRTELKTIVNELSMIIPSSNIYQSLFQMAVDDVNGGSIANSIFRKVVSDTTNHETKFRQTQYKHGLYQYSLLQAAQDSLRATQLLENYSSSWILAGEILSELWKLEQSIQYYDRSLELDSSLSSRVEPIIGRLKKRQELLNHAIAYGWSEDTLRLALDVAR